MHESSDSWLSRFVGVLAQLGQRRGTLLLVLLALSACCRPYGGIIDDTRLYSVQVLNRLSPERYGDDLFFRYGSQDQYSAFSLLMAPLVATLGLEPAFFLVYVAADVLFFWALLRLVQRLIPDPATSTLALLLLAAAWLPYGGLDILHVHEPFLTPRLPALSFTLWSLAFTLEGRYRLALAPLAAAVLLHPLMAVAGLLVWAGCLAVDRLGWRWSALLTAALGAVAIFLLTLPAATRYLGVMDEPWRQAILAASPFNFPTEWRPVDWVSIAMSLVGIGFLAAYTRDPQVARFLAVAVVVGVAAIVGSYLSCWLPVALLLQGQPYRALWLIKLLQIPTGLALVVVAWRSQRAALHAVALLVIASFLIPEPWLLPWMLPALVLPVAVLAFRGLEPTPRVADWARLAVLTAIVVGSVGWGAYKAGVLIAFRSEVLKRADDIDLLRVVILQLGIVVPVALCIVLVGKAFASRRRLALAISSLVLFVTVEAGFAVAPHTAFVRAGHSSSLPNIVFAREYLEKTGNLTESRNASLYAPYGRLDWVWLELGSRCYFDWWQAGGFMFSRQQALEGQRRAHVVAPFEIGRFRELDGLGPDATRLVERFLGYPVEGPTATVEDLARLCQEPDLDFALLKEEFPGLYCATNGKIFVYDCRQVRAALHLETPKEMQAEAGSVPGPLARSHP